MDGEGVRGTLSRVVKGEYQMPQGVSLEAQDLIGRLLQKVRGTPWPYPVWGIPLFCMHKLIYSFMCVIQLMIVCCTHTQVCVCMFAVIVYFLVHLLQNPKHRLKLQDILNHPFTRGATMTSYMSLTGGNNVRSTLLCTFAARSRPSVIGGYICTGTYIHMYLFWEHSTGNYTYLQTKLRSVD